MKTKFYLLTFTLFFLCCRLYALPCPNGNGILYKGDSVAQVIQQCGKPTTQRTEKEVVSSLEQWTYTRQHPYDSGYAQLYVTFYNGRVSNIVISDEYPYPLIYCRQLVWQQATGATSQTLCGNTPYNAPYTNLCGRVFGLGDSISAVASFCGRPNSTNNLGSTTIEQTQLIYNTQGGAETIVFENDKLTDFK